MALRPTGLPTAASSPEPHTVAGPDGADPSIAQRASWLVWSLVLLAAALGAGTVVLAVLDGRGRQLLLDGTATLLVLSVAFAAVGALLAGRSRGVLLGWIAVAAGLCQGLLAFSEEYAVRALLVAPGSLPLGAEASWLKEWIWVPGLGGVLVFVPLLFPDGRPPSPRWWAVGWVGAAAILLGCLSAGWPVWSFRGVALLADGGTAEYRLAPGWARLTDSVVFPLLVVAGVGALASLVVRLRRMAADQRGPVVWLLAAAVLMVAATLMFQLAPTPRADALDIALAVVGLLAAPSIPVAVGAAALTGRLQGVDLDINRALVYATLAGLVTSGYILVVAGVGRLLSAEDRLFVAFLATGLVAVLVAPARARLQRAVNRLVYGDRDDPYAALSLLARRTGSAVEPRAVVQAVAETVARALRVPYVRVEVGRAGTGRPPDAVAEIGRPADGSVTIPLEHRGERLGRLVASPRGPGQPLNPADRRLLEDLARQAAPAVHSVQLALELQRSRERLVLAREEERRRLRRTLHDEVGPSLSSAVLKVAAVRKRLPAGSPAGDLLDELRGDLRATVRDVRTLAYDLRPPTLDQLGLPNALAEFVQAHWDALDDGWAVVTTVETDGDLPPLPAAVEVAAYWIAREALSNVARHAGARHCRVRLALDGPPGWRRLVLDVTDDGCGFHSGSVAGVGTLTMRERAEELGGSLVVTSSGQGTRVAAWLPADGIAG